MIQAELIADTQHGGKRITTFRLTYPLFIHAQVLRHRVFSSSVSSARAIQPAKYRKLVADNPVRPLQFGGAKKGMVAGQPLTGWAQEAASIAWHNALENALRAHEELEQLGVHQEVANRLLAPFAHVTHLVTSTEWANWYDLRLAPDAQPEIRELAYQMHALHRHPPISSEVHRPFLAPEEFWLPDAPLVSAARCARVSYLSEATKSWDESVAFAKKLAQDKHWSPFEHVATAQLGPCRNFNGWRQLRAELENA